MRSWTRVRSAEPSAAVQYQLGAGRVEELDVEVGVQHGDLRRSRAKGE